MRNKNLKKKKAHKFRFLLDTAFAKPQIFSRLYKKASVKHVRHDFKLTPQTEDEEIYRLASTKGLFVVTLDLGFRKLVRQNGAGVFILSSGLSNEDIDSKLLNFISGKDPADYTGKAIKLK